MFTHLLFATIVGQGVGSADTGISLTDLKKLMSDAGYTIVRTVGNGQFVVKRARYDGERSFIVEFGKYDMASVSDRKVQSVLATVEFAVSHDVDVVPPYDLASDVAKHVKTTLTPHLGDTISSTSVITGIPQLSRTELIESINAIWETVDQYAKKMNPKFEQASGLRKEHMKGCEKRLFTYPDKDSLERLVAYWGWDKNTWYGGSSGGWFVPAKVGPYVGWLRGIAGLKATDRLYFSVQSLVKGFPTNTDDWQARNASRYPWVRFEGGYEPGELACVGDIELTPKTTVSSMKKDVMAFIGRLKKLQKELR